MIKVNLGDTYSTFSIGSFEVYFKGLLRFENQQINHANGFADLLMDNCKGEVNTDLWNYINNVLLKYVNGEFSYVIADGNNVIAAVDIVRTHPLFIVQDADVWVITDMLSKVDEELVVDDKALEMYIACNMVLGNKTVYENVFSIQAGEILSINGNCIDSERYFEFLPTKETKSYQDTQLFLKDYEEVLLSVFSRMIENNPSVNNWIIPLSGGRDSRLAVNLLYRLGIKNVICYSYGHLNNEQSNISKQVAEALGYKWVFVEYTEKKWFDLHENGLFDDYVNFSFNGTSTPHLQDFLAVYELTKNNIIVKGDVIVKSHGDFIAGNHFSDTDINIGTLDQAIERIIRQHVQIQNKENTIYRKLVAMYEETNMEYKNIPDHFNWQERQAKLMVNSVRVYGYFGLKSQLPFWDRENVDFWLQVSAEQRVQRNMFLKIVQNLLVEELVSIPYASVVNATFLASIRGYIVKLFPKYIINYILKITGRKVYLNEGMNLIFSLKSPSVKELLSPIDDFSEDLLLYFKDILSRNTSQVNHSLTALYTVRKAVLDKRKQ